MHKQTNRSQIESGFLIPERNKQMTKEKYKELLEGELKLLNKFSTDEGFLYLSAEDKSAMIQLIDLKLRIAVSLLEIEEKEKSKIQ